MPCDWPRTGKQEEKVSTPHVGSRGHLGARRPRAVLPQPQAEPPAPPNPDPEVGSATDLLHALERSSWNSHFGSASGQLPTTTLKIAKNGG